MDADDVAHPERLQVQLEELERDPKLDVVSCRVAHFSDNGPVGRGFQLYEEWLNALVCHEDILRERFVESPLPHPTVMARKRVLLAAGGYRDRGWPEDYDLWLRLAERGCRFGKVPRVLLHWRDHGDRLTRNDSRYAVERFLERKAHPPSAFIDIDPSKWGRTVRGAPVHPPERLPELLQGEPAMLLAAVSSRGARRKIRRHLESLGLMETRDYWCVA